MARLPGGEDQPFAIKSMCPAAGSVKDSRAFLLLANPSPCGVLRLELGPSAEPLADPSLSLVNAGDAAHDQCAVLQVLTEHMGV